MALAKLGNKRAPREVLAAARTYYVRTDGSDSNDGLANTAVRAFLTIQKAIDVAANLDSRIFDVTIQIGAGTFDIAGGGLVAKNMVGAGSITIIGDEATPANVIVKNSGAPAAGTGIFESRNVKTTYKLRGLKFISTASTSVYGIVAAYASYVEFQNCEFSTGMTMHVRAEDTGTIRATGNYSVTGGGYSHLGTVAGAVLRISGVTVTFVGTPAFNYFLDANRASIIYYNANTFVGSVTCARYLINENSVVVAGNETYLPGNAPGTKNGGGVYNSIMGGVRDLLTANRIYYVRTDGSDSNDGLTNTAGGAFSTVQKALDVAGTLDFSIFSVTIQIGDGTYSGAGPNVVKPWVGSGGLTIQGNVSNKNSVIISRTSGHAFITNGNLPGQLQLQYMKLQTTTSGDGILHAFAGTLVFGNINFGACAGNHISVQNTGYVVAVANYFISGNAISHISAVLGGKVFTGSRTITFEANCTVTAFVYSDRQAGVYADAMTFTLSGFTVTGQRYSVSTLGLIQTGGGGATYFPGSIAGAGTNPGTSPYGLYS